MQIRGDLDKLDETDNTIDVARAIAQSMSPPDRAAPSAPKMTTPTKEQIALQFAAMSKEDSPIVVEDDVEPVAPSEKNKSPQKCKDGHADCDIVHKDGRFPNV